MKNLPKKIYLNFGDAFVGDTDYDSTDFKDLEEVSWCEERIDEYDHCYIDDSEFERLAKENERLKTEVEKLTLQNKTYKMQITVKDESLHKKNLALDALGFVWCSGGCEGGAYRFTDKELTEEMVKEAEINTSRLRSHFENLKLRKRWNAERGK